MFPFVELGDACWWCCGMAFRVAMASVVHLLLLGERLHHPTDLRLVPGEGLGSPFRRCRRLSTIPPEPMELSALLSPASWVFSRPAGVSAGWIALGGGLHHLQDVLVL